MLPDYVENCQYIATSNPDWKMNLYYSQDREDFIRKEFDSEILNAYLSIDSRYGAARADFFRYLVVYVEGGLYLDIKATAMKPLSGVIRDEDQFVAAHWPEQIDGIDLTEIGKHKELGFPEYQNWFILSTKKNIVLENVINEILQNLRDYRPMKHGVGKNGVLRTTGPVAYSRAIHSFFLNGTARLATNEELGLKPTIHTIQSSEFPFPNMQNTKHYSDLRIPLIRRSALHSSLVSLLYRLLFKLRLTV